MMNLMQYKIYLNFLVFGIMAFKASKGTEKLMALLIIAMGLGAIIIPYIQMHPELGIQL